MELAAQCQLERKKERGTEIDIEGTEIDIEGGTTTLTSLASIDCM